MAIHIYLPARPSGKPRRSKDSKQPLETWKKEVKEKAPKAKISSNGNKTQIKDGG